MFQVTDNFEKFWIEELNYDFFEKLKLDMNIVVDYEEFFDNFRKSFEKEGTESLEI